jgi:hypothetical protein
VLTLVFLPALYATWFRVKKEDVHETAPLKVAMERPRFAVAAESPGPLSRIERRSNP